MENRNLANWALAAAFIVFLLALGLERLEPGSICWHWLRWAAESAVVGGVADWFAVNALFRKPLGFPWHTALIPRHRQRVTEAVAQLVETELLNMAALRQRVAQVRLAERVIDWIEERGSRYWLQRMLEALTLLDGARWGRELLVLWRSQIRRWPIEAWLPRIAGWALQDERYRRMLSVLAEALAKLTARAEVEWEILQLLERWKAAKQQDSLLNKMLLWLGEATDAVNLPAAAKTAQRSLQEFFHELQQPQHPLYEWLRDQLQRLAEDAPAQRQWSAVIRDGLRGLLDAATARFLAEQIIELLKQEHSPLRRWLLEFGEESWQRVSASATARAWLETVLQAAVQRLLESEHSLIGRLVRLVLAHFSDEELNRFVEEKAGEDLQWIRVNGVLVGAAAGTMLFALLQFAYRPLLGL